MGSKVSLLCTLSNINSLSTNHSQVKTKTRLDALITPARELHSNTGRVPLYTREFPGHPRNSKVAS